MGDEALSLWNKHCSSAVLGAVYNSTNEPLSPWDKYCSRSERGVGVRAIAIHAKSRTKRAERSLSKTPTPT